MKRTDETVEGFRARINKVVREAGVSSNAKAKHGWFLGTQLQTRGSVVSDEWSGSATDLADSEALAIFPKIGWWRSLTKEKCWDNQAHYSLVISISTPEEGVDLYTLIENQIEVMTPVQLELPLGT